MIEISLYRSRIGSFSNLGKRLRTSRFKKYQNYDSTSQKTGKFVLTFLQGLLKFLLLCSLLPNFQFESHALAAAEPYFFSVSHLPGALPGSQCLAGVGTWQSPVLCLNQPQTRGKKLSINFLTRYLYGNRSKGIINML